MNVAPESRTMQVSTTTLALGAVATAATTMSLTLMATPTSHPVNKFASNKPVASERSVAMRAGWFGGGGKPSAPVRAPPSFDIMEEEGILPPVGYLDPLGFGEKASPERLRWFREAELKHGRVAMLAAVGFLVGENPDLKDALFPGLGSDLASNTLTDHKLDNFWYAFIAGVGALEVQFFDKFDDILSWKLSDDYEVGDLGFDPLNLKTEDNFAEKRTKELQNGRLAMLALAGFNAQELTDGKPIWPIHGLDSASAAETQQHVTKGMELVKEMGQMLAETSAVTHTH
jgi:hypothetical protein